MLLKIDFTFYKAIRFLNSGQIKMLKMKAKWMIKPILRRVEWKSKE